MKGLEIRITPVLILGIEVVLLAQFVAGSSWHLGCIHDNASSQVSESLLQDLRGNSVFIPASCARSCRDRGFLCAGLQGTDNCRCSNIIGEFGQRIADQQCNITCGNVSLPCGGDSAVSVYSVDGPYLLTAELSKTQHLVQEGSTVRFEARVSLAAEAESDIGLDGFNTSHFDEIIFTWSVDGEQIGISSHRYGNSSAVDSFVHSFNQEGKWQIDVEASNPISSLSRTTSITVVLPLPADLQVILRPTQGDTPSCVPVEEITSSSTLPDVSLFVGEEVEFQASVAMGINLTFVWMFDDYNDETELAVEEPECEGIACMQDTQVYTYTTEGRYNVVVNVSNFLGSVQKTLHVVVVTREITNLSMSLSSNSAFINKVNTSLGLLITMTSTARQQVLLQVDFGDGSVYNHSMYDVNDTFITVGDEDSAHLHLTASYGEGCTLFVSLSHTYGHAGVFTVEAKVFQKWNSESVGSAKLESAVTVQNELGPVQIETQQVYSTNTLANFSLTIPVVTTNMSFLWRVSSNNLTLNLDCQQEPTCLYNFTEPGQYTLNVTAWNLVSMSHAQDTVAVQEAIRGLVLIGGSSGILPTGATIQFAASIQAGSDTQFTWYFSDILGFTKQQDNLVSSLPNSHANHTYYMSGMYNVSITASNEVGSETALLPQGILVQDPVLGLSLVSTGPTLLGDPIHINVTLLQGTHVTFTVNIEYGQETPAVQHLQDDNTYLLELAMSNPGVFHATVVASNNISSENATLCMVVQESVGRVSIKEFYPGNGDLVLLARLDGEIPNRTDVMYTWLVRGENITSASPLLSLPVPLQPEVVSIQANNQVDASSVELALDSSTPQTTYSLNCPTYKEVGTPVSLALQIPGDGTSSPVQVVISYGDSTPNVTLTVTPGVPLTWNHTYPHPGVYPLGLWYNQEGEVINGETVIVVEKPISSVLLSGPEISKFFGSVTTQTWEVTPASGTDILYTWTIVPIRTDYSHGTETSAAVIMTPIRLAGSHGKVSIPFHAPGHYNITLQASNLISSVTLHSETILQQPIIQATVLVDTALISTPSTYQIIIKGGPPFHFKIDFGIDRESITTTSEELALQGNEIIDYLFDPPVCIYTFNETYPSLGWYGSSFMISNLISETMVTATAKVEERISGLTLTSESSSLLAIGHTVILKAEVETGNDVDFAWDFQDPGESTIFQNCLNSSRATHTFSQPGTYQVSVGASNFLQPQPLMVIYPQPFIVQEAPFALELRTPSGKTLGAPLYDFGEYWATHVLSFEAQCWGSHLVFYFDYGDGTVEKVEGVLDVFGSYNAAGSHQYFEDGNYTVGVTAGNQLGNETRYLPQPYYVQVPPTSFQCERSYYAHAFGNVLHLSVRVEAGTHLFYNWSMGDQTDYIDVGPSVNHVYRSAGHFSVTVVAFNKVQKAQATCMVSIEVQVQGVQLIVEKRLYQTYTHITLEAMTITNSALWYQWDMGDQRDVQTTSVNTLTYLYSSHGRYYVTVLASNHVSNATSIPIELTLQTAIKSAAINSQSATLVNQTTLFEAWVFTGSDMNFVWDFGDGMGKVYTTALSIYHKYNRTGEFFLHLEASNLVSNSTATSKIFVLTRMCHPPILDIVGDDPRKVKHSEDIRIEAEVKIDCEVTNLALYTWRITYADNDSVTVLDPAIASLKQRTLFMPRRYLPYGSYFFALDVVMNGTIVYAHDSITVEVTKSPLMSIIEGGTRRYFSHDMIATLNGSFSFDPDNPEEDNLRYSWTCHPLTIPTASCFNATAVSITNQTSILPSSNASIVFSTSWLLPNGSSSFVFTLRVSKEGKSDSEITQVLSLETEVVGTERRNMQVSIDCPKCEDGFVNANDQLTLEALCPECDENTTYAWELYIVQDGTTSNSHSDSTSGRRCSYGDGSYGQYLVANDSSPSSPLSNPEEDSNIINQSTQSISSTSTPQNSVSNAINSGLMASDGAGDGSVPDISQPNSTSSLNQTSGEASESSASQPHVTVSTGDNFEEEYVEDIETSSKLAEEISTNIDVTSNETILEEPAGTLVTVTSHVEDLGNSESLNGSSFEEAGGSFEEAASSFEEVVDSFVEAGGSLAESGGSFEEAAGSFDEAASSFEEAAGSFEEAVGSFAVTGVSLNEINGSISEEGLPEEPGPTGSNATDGSSDPQQPSNADGDYEEALESSYEDTAPSTSQPSQNASQPVNGNDGSVGEHPGDDYYGNYPEYPDEYLSSNDEPGLNLPPPPDTNTDSGNDKGADPVVDLDVEPVINEHIVSKTRQQIVLNLEDTTMGLSGRALTIKQGILEENRTYALVVHIQSKENGMTRSGEAHQYALVNTGPRAGRCSITPKKGNEMETVFTINCLGWQDKHTPIQYEVSYSLNETEDLTVLYFGMKHAVKFQLPAGYADNDHLVYVKVAIVDGQGGKTSVCSINIQVLPKMFNPGESVEEFLYNVTVAPRNLLSVYVQQGDQHNLNGFINMAACILNRQPALSGSDSSYTWLLSLRRQIRFALVSASVALPMRDQFEIQQSSMATAASSYAPLELQVNTILLASQLIDSCKAKTVVNVALVGELDVDILVALTSTFSSVVSALDMDHTETIRLQHRKTTFERSLRAVLELLKTYLQLQKPDEEPLLIQTNSVDLLGSRQTSLATVDVAAGHNAFLLPNGIEQALYAENGEDVIGAYLCHNMAIPCWDIDMVTYRANPYKWGRGASKVTTGVSSLNLHSCTGHDLVLENLAAGREIIFEVAHTCGHLEDSLTCNLTIDKAFMNVHEFNVSSENMRQSFQIMVRLAPEARRTFPIKVIMRYGSRPTPTAFDRSWLYEKEDEDLVIFLPPNTFNVSGVYYIALLDADHRDTYRQDEVSHRQYLIRLWWGECLYWDTDYDAWVGDGCEVMQSSTYELTRCKCNHLTSFGVTFLPIFIILHVVDLAVFETPNANPITYSFTAGILSIYILLYIYCYLADKHDERKQGLIYLWDNQPADQQYYEITVETGMRAGAGTTARVSVVLHGEEGHSETKELICKGRPLFEKNSRDRFIVSVPESLGNMQRVHVWHNNAGHSPSWFLSRIAVRDLITGQKWYFICERWFAVEEDDGKIERELEVMDKGVGFQKAFFAKLFQYFADYYLWSSIFTRPPYSVFTRAQRLTCCLCISMGFMCINTIWYQHLDKEDVELGLIDVSGEAMLVGIVTAVLAIPINFPVIMIFRRAKPRCEEIEKEKNFRSVKKTIELPESAEPVETILNKGSLDSGVGEHSDVTLEDLQGWAQEKWKHRLKGSSNHSENTHSSYDSFSFSSTIYDDALSTHSSNTHSCNTQSSNTNSSNTNSSNTNTSSHLGLISDSGVSSPDTRSLQSSYLSACYQADHKRLSSPKIWLPNWCCKLAWGICGIITIFSAGVCIYYGYRFSNVKSVSWMQSVYFSFLQCIFVTQPAVMLMFTIVKSVRHKNNIRIFDHYDDNIDLIDKTSLERGRLEAYENNMVKAIAARQRSRYLRFARPPQEKELQKAKEKMLKEKNMWAILKDVIMYITLFACLMWMAYGREVAFHHPVNQGIRQTYLQTPHPFTRISSVNDLWLWLNDDLMDGLYWEKWYNSESVTEEKNSIMNGESILLGKASLRQVRVRHHSCPIARPAQSLFQDCKSGYSLDKHSTESYGPDRVWVHSSKEALRRYCKWGYFGSYEGDGFAVDLNRSREEAIAQLEFLQNNSWIDDQTRAVIVEFTIYNAPTNLYTSVALLAEMPGTGAVVPFPKIESVLLYRYETVCDYFIMCCELLFLLLVAVSGKREVQKLVKIRAKFFQSMWSWMEMGMILLSLTYFAMYVCRFMYVNNATQHLRGTYMEEFVDMSLLAYWDQILTDLLACLIFLVSVKFLRLLRFNQTVAMFGAVIDGAIKEILSFALYILVLEVAFACLGVLLFSSHFYPLKHLYVSTNVLNAMVMGHPPDYEDLAAQFPILWHLFYFTYVVSMIIMMAGLIKAVLCHSYKQAKHRHVDAVGGKEVVHFFWNKFLISVGLRMLPEEDKPTTLPTEFTMAEIEYQVDELLFRMSAITHQHGLPEKPHGYFEDSDGTHGMMEDGMSSTCSELNLFDSARLEDRVQKIETQLYGHNPELRELLDGNCFTDEDREKQLRAHLEMEIFRQLQLQRQEDYHLQHELHDSGHDTQSTSEHMELGSDNVSLDQPLNIRDAQGRLNFPKPLQNLGTLETQATSTRAHPSIFTNRKQAWGQQSSTLERPVYRGQNMTQGQTRVTTPQSTTDTTRRPYTTGMADKHKTPDRRVKPVSASFVRRDPQLLSSSEVLDSQSSSSSSYVHRTDSLSSHASDIVTSQVNEALSMSRNWNRSAAQRRDPKPNMEHIIRDYPEGVQSPVERAVSIESFPLPNALDGLSSSSGNEDRKYSKLHRGNKESEARHRLRKTRSRGKGKGRQRYDEAIYVNDAFSTDSEDDIPVIQMGPAMHHDRK